MYHRLGLLRTESRSPMHSNAPLRTFKQRIWEERGNCFLYGCVTVVILCLIGGLIAFLVARNFFGKIREKYTETAPIELPTVEMSAEQIDALIKRVDQYAVDLRAGKPVPTL